MERLLIFILLLLINCISYSHAGQTKAYSKTTIKNNLYKNNDYKFAIEFPEGWKIVDSDNPRIVKKAVHANSSIVIWAEELPNKNIDFKTFTKLEILDFLQEQLIELSNTCPNFQIIEKGIRYLNNKKSIYFKYTFSEQNTNLNFITIQYSTIHKGVFYTLGGGSIISEFNSNEYIIKKTIASFVFLNNDSQENNRLLDNNKNEHLFSNFNQKDLIKYQDSRNKFVIFYPKTWSIVQPTHKNTKFKIVSENGSGAEDLTINIQEMNEKESITPEEFVKNLKNSKILENQLKNTFTAVKIIDNGTTIISNQVAYYMIYSYMYKSFGIEREINGILIQTIKNNLIYTIGTRTSDPYNFDELMLLFKYTVSGFLIK